MVTFVMKCNYLSRRFFHFTSLKPMPFNIQDLLQTLPLTLLLVTGLLLMISDALGIHKLLPWLTGLGLTFSMILSLPLQPENQMVSLVYNDMFKVGGLASFVHIALCLSALLSLFFIDDFFKRHHKEIQEVYALLIFSVIGMIMLANANDLTVTFVGLETMSICLYIMAALFKANVRSNEAGMKYFLLGSFATGFLLMGMALIYGATGVTQYTQMNPLELKASPLFYPGVLLVLIGFMFKVSAFPFHSWTPDVYTGTPTPLTGFMATAGKNAAFVALGIFLQQIMPTPDPKIILILSIAALTSMVFGNFLAIRQTNLKRLLAFSSIAHSGYVLLGLCAGKEGFLAVLFYMFIYTLMNVGAFGLIGMNENEDEDAEIHRWNGIGLRKPWFGIAMSVFLFSMAGIPPLAGFMSKYQVFFSAIRAELYWLAILGILTSVVGAYYYIKVIVNMYFLKPDGETGNVNLPSFQITPVIGVAVLVLLTVILGIFPSWVYTYIENLYSQAGNIITSVH
jgi:NADH-quinone oxidoreductase subunit N